MKEEKCGGDCKLRKWKPGEFEQWKKKRKDLPKGFKEGTCKCGNKYFYCGLDIKHCVKCIDACEVEK